MPTPSRKNHRDAIAVTGHDDEHDDEREDERDGERDETRSAARGGGSAHTRIAGCVQQELRRYFELLDGQAPADLYRMVMRQAESALIVSVLEECGGNQSRAACWLGISRGTLRGKLAKLDAAKAARRT